MKLNHSSYRLVTLLQTLRWEKIIPKINCINLTQKTNNKRISDCYRKDKLKKRSFFSDAANSFSILFYPVLAMTREST